MTTTTEPTLLEQIHALKETVARLAAERDQAVAGENRAHVKMRVGIEVNRHLRNELDAKDRENRHLRAERNRLAIERSDLEQLVDRERQLPVQAVLRRTRLLTRIAKRIASLWRSQ